MWHEVYDFIEYVANNYDLYDFSANFQEACNKLFEKQMSGYRFIDGIITRITEQEEMEEVEIAINTSEGSVSTHIRRALELLSDRENPDYRNSIKESISAVEGIVARVLKSNSGTLGQMLKKLDEAVHMHPAIKEAFSKLYGYTSDKGGIRHALLEEETLDFHDAKFMLIACSAFVNFVRGKSEVSA
jgi:hypothetical protein